MTKRKGKGRGSRPPGDQVPVEGAAEASQQQQNPQGRGRGSRQQSEVKPGEEAACFQPPLRGRGRGARVHSDVEPGQETSQWQNRPQGRGRGPQQHHDVRPGEEQKPQYQHSSRGSWRTRQSERPSEQEVRGHRDEGSGSGFQSTPQPVKSEAQAYGRFEEGPGSGQGAWSEAGAKKSQAGRPPSEGAQRGAWGTTESVKPKTPQAWPRVDEEPRRDRRGDFRQERDDNSQGQEWRQQPTPQTNWRKTPSKSPFEQKSSGSDVSPQSSLRSACVKTPPRKPKEQESSRSDISSPGSVEGSVRRLGLESGDRSPSGSDTPSHSSDESGLIMATRPGFGTQGRKIQVISNFFEMKCKTDIVYHYDVEITRLEKSNRRDGRAPPANGVRKSNANRAEYEQVMAQIKREHRLEQYSMIYDGNKNIFTSSPLPFKGHKSFTIDLEVCGKMKQYDIKIQPVLKKLGGYSNEIHIRKQLSDLYSGSSKAVPNEALLALNAIYNFREPNSRQIQVGRGCFFFTNHQRLNIGDGAEIWLGYNQSVHLTQHGPALVVNLSAKAFHKAIPVLDYASEILRKDVTRGPLRHFEVDKLKSALKGVRVRVTHLKYERKYYIEDITPTAARETMIDDRTTVESYFRATYYPLKFPNVNCLRMRSSNNKTYIPFEVCVVCDNQPIKGVLNGFLQSEMIKRSAYEPKERFDKIYENIRHIRDQSGQQMDNYGVSMNLQPREVEARVIEPPDLLYTHLIMPDKGVWNAGANFYSLPKIKSWVLLNFSNDVTHLLKDFSDSFKAAGRKFGLDFTKLLNVKTVDQGARAEVVLKEAKDSGASFAVIILSKRNNRYFSYEEVKFISDYKLGFVTQCLSDQNVVSNFERRPQNKFTFLANLCLKVNSKLGGVNHILGSRKLALFQKPVIVFGADAVHSPPNGPSVASVVGSLDSDLKAYKVACKIQENPHQNKSCQELILKMKEMVQSIFKAYRDNTLGKYPEKIIFFRDGVSEGQFNAVLKNEVDDIKSAALEFFGQSIPVTFIIVQKRHQMRFKPKDPRDGVGKAGNIAPGTVIEKDVTHPLYFDYFLNSHQGIKGTNKPAKYTILYDENNISVDDLQKLSYHLCYVYARCNRSISIPAPVKYADLACYRAKKYLDWLITKTRCDPSNIPKEAREAVNSMILFKNNMFYV